MLGLLFAGRLADLYGRKTLFLIGLTIFFTFSILSAVIHLRVPLCVVRALAGLGLAIASPAGYGIIGANIRFEPERTIVFAAFGLGNPVGASIGTIMSGAVAGTSRHGWTYLFYIIAGASLVPMVIGILVIPRETRRLRGDGRDRRIDWLGGLLVTAGTSLFMFSIVQSGIVPKGWSTPYVPVVLVLSILLILVFLVWERHLETHTSFPPIVKFSLFTRHSYMITAVVLGAFFNSASVYGFIYVMTIFYQNYKGLNALENAVRWLPACIIGLVAAGSVMVLAPRVRAPTLIVSGSVMGGIGCMLFAVEPAGTNYWACEFIGLLILPFGIDYAVGIGNILVSNLVSEDEQSVGGALFQTGNQIGAALGICIASLVSSQRTAATHDLLTGLRSAYWMLAAFAWTVPLIVIVGFRRVRLAKDVIEVA
ncbi:MAG: hypothetical protein TREMPRED_005476 [Tremellales sp. Tagirdzhanova-0007]|nr:MAG: hypothetical protein TREMPRED_005476 [Tremellales sp. Tagirdzhanova-0007]